MKANVLAIDGSSKLNTNGSNRRNNGRLSRLLKESLGAAEAECETLGLESEVDIVHLHEVMKGFHSGNFESIPEWIVPTFEKMLKADIIIYGSPVQWYSMSSLMKSFVEHLTSLEYGPELLGDIFPGHNLKEGRQLDGKIMGIMVTCEEDGGQQVAASLCGPLSDMGHHLPRGCMVYQNRKMKHISEDKWQIRYPRLIGQNTVRMFALMNGIKVTTGWELPEDE